MAEEGPWCGFKRKTVCMTTIALCCLALVAWTVAVTAHTPEAKKSLNSTLANATLGGPYPTPCTFNASVSLDNVKMIINKDGDYNITRRNFVAKVEGKSKTLCKCFCRMNITEQQLMEAVRYIRRSKNLTEVIPPKN